MKQSMKITALFLALLLVFAACGPKTNTAPSEASESTAPASSEAPASEVSEESTEENASDNPVTIVFWHAMNGAQEEALTKITDDFTKENPNITVDLQNQTGYGELQQKITSTSASPKDLPTITQAYPGWMYSLIQDGLVHDLSTYVTTVPEYEDIFESFRQGTIIDGKTYSMPFNKSTEVLWYNQTLLDELGLEVPTTYDELKDVSKKIYDEKGIPGVGFDSLSNFFITYLESNGVVYDNNFDPSSDIAKEAVNYYLDGVKEGYFRIAGTDKYMSGPFGNEQVAMYIGSNAGETYVVQGVDGKFEAKAAPSPTDKRIAQGTDIFVFEGADDAQKEAAYQYLTYITGEKQQIEWGISTGYIPARQKSVASDEYANSGSLIAPILEEATKNLYAIPTVSGANQAYDEVKNMLEGVLASPESADVESAIENFKLNLEGIWTPDK